MSDLKISQLPDGAPAITTDIFPIERSFIGNFRLTIQNIITFITTYVFPSLSATTYTSVTINSDSLKATGNVSVAGDLLVSGTTTHTGLVTNNDSVTTTGAVTHNGTTTLNSTATFNGTAITYGNMTHNGTTVFNAAVTRGTYSSDGNGTKFDGPLTTTGTTNLATGAVLSTDIFSVTPSNTIATTAFLYPTQFGYDQNFFNVTNSRNFSQTYYNLSNKPMAVFVSVRLTNTWYDTNFYAAISIYVNDVYISAAFVYTNIAGQNPGQSTWAVVPPSGSYKVTTSYSGIVLLSWVELS